MKNYFYKHSKKGLIYYFLNVKKKKTKFILMKIVCVDMVLPGICNLLIAFRCAQRRY